METNSPLKKEKQCYFCYNNIHDIDYKDVGILRRFLSSFGKIVPSKRSKMCTKHQRGLADAIKRARVMALVPFLVR